MTGKRLLLLCCWLPVSAHAQTIYKCTEPGGGVLISNSKVHKNCQAIVGESSHAAPAPAARTPTARVISASPGGFPKVEENTQRARDADRRHILEQELATEQRKLTQAQQELAALAGGAGGGERTVPLRERVNQHERNIQAIQKELNVLR